MFGTSGVRGPVGDAITGELALSLGRALASTGYQRVVVGRDPRESGEFLEAALTAGLRECGADVILLGQAATPTVARAISARQAAGGVSITASHNPAPDNGIKLWNPSGQAFDADQRAAITQAVEQERYRLASWDGLGEVERWNDAVRAHRQQLVEAGGSLEGLTVAVDIGNGAGGVTVDALIELGATVETLNATPDGRFPGRPSEPTAETCRSLRHFVANTNADLGIAHDGDADRLMAVDETGAFVPGDVLLGIFGSHEVEHGDQVVAPVNTSLAVDETLAEQGATLTRTRVGDVYVAEQIARDGAVFGGEPSGAWIWPNETLCPDGPLAAVKLADLVATEGPLSAQAGAIEDYPLQRTSVEVDTKGALMERVRDAILAEYRDVTTIDGVRVETEDGWFLIRASGTQPLIRVTAEARDDARCETLLEEATALLERCRTAVR